MMEQVTQVLINVIIALIGLAGAYLVMYLKKLQAKVELQTVQIADENQKKLVNDALDRITDLAQKTVAQIEQTTAKDLRQAVADGKVDKSELEALGQQAVTEIYSQLSLDAKAVLSTEVNDIQAYILNTVESELLKLKTTNTTANVINNSTAKEVPEKSITVEDTVTK
jgi:hypothetical protein